MVALTANQIGVDGAIKLKKILGLQIRAARAILRWRAEDLALKTSLGVATIRRAEAEDGPPAMTPANAQAVRTAFENAGIVFLDEPDHPGVKFSSLP